MMERMRNVYPPPSPLPPPLSPLPFLLKLVTLRRGSFLCNRLLIFHFFSNNYIHQKCALNNLYIRLNYQLTGWEVHHFGPQSPMYNDCILSWKVRPYVWLVFPVKVQFSSRFYLRPSFSKFNARFTQPCHSFFNFTIRFNLSLFFSKINVCFIQVQRALFKLEIRFIQA